jgi:hypothetical protein
MDHLGDMRTMQGLLMSHLEHFAAWASVLQVCCRNSVVYSVVRGAMTARDVQRATATCHSNMPQQQATATGHSNMAIM